MPLPRLFSDALGVVTISLNLVFVVFALLCVIYSVYFHLRVQKRGLLQLGYFNGPWITRIVLIVVAIWCACGEILRLSLLGGNGRLFTNQTWQKDVCKFYVVSNIGLAEPSFFLILVFLLRASVQKREYGALSHRWNTRATCYTVLFCLPIFVIQLALVFIGPKFSNNEVKGFKLKVAKYFTSSSSITGDIITCTYPLMNTIVLGIFDLVLISYISRLGFWMVSSVINKGLRRRIYFLILSIVLFLPMRVLLLGVSVLPPPDGLIYEATVFMAFVVLLFCVLVGICMLVYYPVADSLALRRLRYREIEVTTQDDYFDGASSLMVNQSRLDAGRSSDASTRQGSSSFRTNKDELPASMDGYGESIMFSPFTSINSSPLETRPF